MGTMTKGSYSSSSSWLKATIFLLLLALAGAGARALTTDGLALLALKSAVSLDPTSALASWLDTDATPCAWHGVTCVGGRVTELDLAGGALTGYIPSELSLLSALQSLVLSGNRISGPIPVAIAELGNLSELDLSRNRLSGPIPPEIGHLSSLSHLDLSANFLNGTLPPTVAALPHLSGVLNLSYNLLSGPIPAAYGNIPADVSLDLRRNNLSGEIPQAGSLLNQGPTAFAGNPWLCGFPLKKLCLGSEKNPKEPQPSLNFTLNPSSPGSQPPEAEKRRKPVTTIFILTGVVLAALLSILVLQWQFRRHRAASEGKGVKKEKSGIAAAASAATLWEEKREGRGSEIFAAVDEDFGLELEELLRASAYVVGKSRSGIIYKVVVGRGSAVAVCRLSEADDDGEGRPGPGGGDDWRRRRAFESEAIAIGRARHPNVVRLLAYYFAPDERLLIFDYIANGTLQSALHGGALNPTVPPLPWSARLAILQGVARGLAYIHEFSPRKYILGNLKSSKILLDDDFRPFISGFGLSRLVSAGAQKLAHSGPAKKLGSARAMGSTRTAAGLISGYTPPEARGPSGGQQQQLTQKGDVYAFGVLAMEVVTGRTVEAELEGWVRAAFKEERPLSEVVDPALLHEVHAKKEVLAIFHVALGCTESDPELRPRMRAVVESLDQIGIAARC